MRRVACFTMATLATVAAFGQGLLDCLEPDVLRALLLENQGQRAPVITGAVPPEIAALRMPGAYTWIGSAERITGRVDATTNASHVTAAWRSSLAPEAARAGVAAALAASGWEVRPQMGAAMSVFRTPMAQTACREGKPVNVNASAMDGVTYVLLTLQRGNNTNTTCNQPARTLPTTGTGLEPHLPRLEMPVDPATGVAARMQSSGASSGGGAINARAEFVVRDSAGSIARHFASQMAQQGWTSDASWSGAATAGSSWSKRPDAGSL
ncbi:MAG TPA: hypothetical protein VMK82_04165, partial [Steroidobacteraceae bacterium]|nr:hypothetical protein [Steroidobacteraceae bacterium]